MEEITNDILLRCLLSNCKVHTKKQQKMFSLLSKKTIYGNEISKDAEMYCVKQGWMENNLTCVPNGKKNGHYYHSEVETNTYGKKMIPILWKSSKVRPWNIWKSRIKVAAPWLIAILAISKSGTILSGLANILRVILTSFSVC